MAGFPKDGKYVDHRPKNQKSCRSRFPVFVRESTTRARAAKSGAANYSSGLAIRQIQITLPRIAWIKLSIRKRIAIGRPILSSHSGSFPNLQEKTGATYRSQL
jgi:hypothetical protein